MTPVREHKPFVPENADMPEFTLRAMIIGLVMCIVLGLLMPTWDCAPVRRSQPPIPRP